MIPLPTKLILALTTFIVVMCGVLVFGQHRYSQGEAAATERALTAISMLKAEASKALAAETAKTRQAEQALNDFKNSQELKDAQSVKTIADLADRLRRSAGAVGRLRDPNAAGCGAGRGGPASDAAAAAPAGPADGAEVGGLLSAELSGLLQQLTVEADQINAAYASCREWIGEVGHAR
jgi:hypothetical protein